MCRRPEDFPLDKPTRSYKKSTSQDKFYGFVAASIFSVAYYLAPTWLFSTILVACVFGFSKPLLIMAIPIMISLLTPSFVIRRIGKFALSTHAFNCIPKYFEYEEFHEVTDKEFGRQVHEAKDPKRYIFAFHPHGVFPFVATCAMCAACGAISDQGPSTYAYKDRVTDDVPTAVATVLLHMPLLKDIVGLFHCIDASAKTLTSRLSHGSFALYVGGMNELFLASPNREVVFLSKRKGFIKLALRTGADVVPTYLFGNTTCLNALTWGPLATISRRLGVSFTLFWGRWLLPLPKPVQLTYARGRPLGLPHIPEPTQADIDHWHQVYCTKLLHIFDHYKQFNPDYEHKTLEIA